MRKVGKVLCKKLKGMIKDEVNGVKEYSELKSDMISENVSESCVNKIEDIAKDEDQHHHDIRKIMKELKCK